MAIDDDRNEAAATEISGGITISPGRLEMPDSRVIAVTSSEVPPTMITTPTRPMSLEGPLAIPEPGSWMLVACGLLGMPWLLRRQRVS